MSMLLVLSMSMTASELTGHALHSVKNAQVLYRSALLLQQLAPQCPAVATALAEEIGADPEQISDLPQWQLQQQAQLDVLFQAQVGIDLQKLEQMLSTLPDFAALTPRLLAPDCADTAAVEDLIYKYQSSLSGLQIRQPISQWTEQFYAAEHPVATKVNWQLWIDKSHSIVLVDVKPKSMISVQQQADFLHYQDKNDYMFVVRQGWKGLSPRFSGVHLPLVQEQTKRVQQVTASSWVLFLDRRMERLHIVQLSKAPEVLHALGPIDWELDLQGNFIRKTAQ